MIVGGKTYQSIWTDTSDPKTVNYINQRLLPFEFRIDTISSSEDALVAIRDMKVRGAPLIGVTGALGVYMACLEAKQEKKGLLYLSERAEKLRSARPTAVNLSRAVDRVMEKIEDTSDPDEKIRVAGGNL